jgi:hypothetical protein
MDRMLPAPPQAQLELLDQLAPLVRGRQPYTVLWSVVSAGNGLGRDEQAALRAVDKNAGRAFDLLEDHGLVRAGKSRWYATKAGRQLVRAVEKAAEASPGSVIEGRRLLSIAATEAGELEAAERILSECDAEILYADGAYELIAVLPDDPELVRDLRAELTRRGHAVSATRIIPRATA